MFAHSRFNHSPAQLVALDGGVTLAHATYRSLMTQARALHDALVPSGTLNPDGTQVLAGANRDTSNLRDTLVSTAEMLRVAVDRDYADLVRYEVRYVGGHFLTEAEMQEGYAHLLAMLPDLRARYPQAEAA